MTVLCRTLWINARSREIVGVEDEGYAHHAELILDNPSRVDVPTSSPAWRRAQNMTFEDVIANQALREAPMRRRWVRANQAGGHVWLEARDEADLVSAALVLREAGCPITTLHVDIAGQPGRSRTFDGGQIDAFLA